jgi:transmembrane sensor
MENKELIQTLIISHFSGHITAEEETCLFEIMAESREARTMYEEINNVLQSSEAKKGRERLKLTPMRTPPKLSFIRKYKTELSVAAMVLVVVGFFLGSDQKTVLPDKNSIQMVLDNGKVINLDKSNTLMFNAGDSAGGMFNYKVGANNREWATVKVPVRKNYKVVLPDGSIITLNSSTSLRFPLAFNGAAREIYINGEAFVDAAFDAAKPLKVYTPKAQAKVLGTSFNINTYNGIEKVSLVTGRLQYVTEQDSAMLIPGKEVVRQADARLVVSSFKLSNSASWMSGIYKFDSTTLLDIAAYIERCYGMKVVFDSPIQDRSFTSVLNQKDSVGAFLNTLTNVQRTIKNDTIHLTLK